MCPHRWTVCEPFYISGPFYSNNLLILSENLMFFSLLLTPSLHANLFRFGILIQSFDLTIFRLKSFSISDSMHCSGNSTFSQFSNEICMYVKHQGNIKAKPALNIFPKITEAIFHWIKIRPNEEDVEKNLLFFLPEFTLILFFHINL